MTEGGKAEADEEKKRERDGEGKEVVVVESRGVKERVIWRDGREERREAEEGAMLCLSSCC